MVDGLNRNVRAEHEDPGAPDEDAAHSQRWQEIGAEIAAKRQSAEPLTHKEGSRRRAQAMVEGLNRHVMARHEENGRASLRAGVWQYGELSGGAVSLKKKKKQ